MIPPKQVDPCERAEALDARLTVIRHNVFRLDYMTTDGERRWCEIIQLPADAYSTRRPGARYPR